MGIEIFNINLADPLRQYSPGEFISGNVHVGISGKEATTEIVLTFYGLAETIWAESDPGHSHHHGNHSNTTGAPSSSSPKSKQKADPSYHAHEDLFNYSLQLFGDGTNRQDIPIGQHVFPFEFQIPLRPLPTSCSFPNGKVIYGLIARIRQPWYKFDPETEAPSINIMTKTIIDLTLTPILANPVQVEDTLTVDCCCCCIQNKLCSMKSFTPKSGFCNGEEIPLTVEINNQGNTPIINVTASLSQLWTFFGDGPRGRHKQTQNIPLQTVTRSEVVGKGEMVKWVTSLTIPSSVPSSQSPLACGIINMEYVINVSAEAKAICCNDHFFLVHPITIGNMPLEPSTPTVVTFGIENEFRKLQ